MQAELTMFVPGTVILNQSNQISSVGLIQRAKKGLFGAFSYPEAEMRVFVYLRVSSVTMENEYYLWSYCPFYLSFHPREYQVSLPCHSEKPDQPDQYTSFS